MQFAVGTNVSWSNPSSPISAERNLETQISPKTFAEFSFNLPQSPLTQFFWNRLILFGLLFFAGLVIWGRGWKLFPFRRRFLVQAQPPRGFTTKEPNRVNSFSLNSLLLAFLLLWKGTTLWLHDFSLAFGSQLCLLVCLLSVSVFVSPNSLLAVALDCLLAVVHDCLGVKFESRFVLTQNYTSVRPQTV